MGIGYALRQDPPELELMLFDFCPYGQRAMITALQGEVPLHLTVLDPDHLPGDFAIISPLGYVPLLRVDGGEMLFESAVISEYLASLSHQDLFPTHALELARMRAWIEFGSACQAGLMQLLQAGDEALCRKRALDLLERLGHLAATLAEDGPYHHGEFFTLIDAAYAPFFQRLRALTGISDMFSEELLPTRLRRWMDTLQETPSVQASVIGDFDKVFRSFIARKAPDGFIQQQLLN